jgi:hypothetical protein
MDVENGESCFSPASSKAMQVVDGGEVDLSLSEQQDEIKIILEKQMAELSLVSKETAINRLAVGRLQRELEDERREGEEKKLRISQLEQQQEEYLADRTKMAAEKRRLVHMLTVEIRELKLDHTRILDTIQVEVGAIEARVNEVFLSSRQQMDSTLNKLSQRERDQLDLVSHLQRVTKKLASMKGKRMTFEKSAEERLCGLEESQHIAKRLLPSLNKLGLDFGKFEVSRRVSWVVGCQELFSRAASLEFEHISCLLPVSERAPLSLKSPMVSIMCEGVGEYECHLVLVCNAEGYLFLHIYLIGPRYPVYLKRSTLQVHGMASYSFGGRDIVLSRATPCEKVLFSVEEARHRAPSEFLDMSVDIRASLMNTAGAASGAGVPNPSYQQQQQQQQNQSSIPVVAGGVGVSSAPSRAETANDGGQAAAAAAAAAAAGIKHSTHNTTTFTADDTVAGAGGTLEKPLELTSNALTAMRKRSASELEQFQSSAHPALEMRGLASLNNVVARTLD